LGKDIFMVYSIHMHNILTAKKTKIVCTLGPATTDEKVLKNLIAAGMNVARLNMSHGNHDEHALRIRNLRNAEKKSGSHIGILLDLSGPKIRTGDYTTPTVMLTPGQNIILTTDTIIGDENRMSISYKKLPSEVKPGSIIMLDDGRRKLEVLKILGNDIHCKIIIGGEIKSRRGVNIPNGYLSLKSLTAKDKTDLSWGLAQGIDFVALSFVRTAQDIKDLMKILTKENKSPKIIAKIETQEAIDNIDEILNYVDGIMIARGDLSVETPRENVPVYQKHLIKKCIARGKFSIVATQMMESMINNPVPTRAETSDAANAIFDGADAIMTSEETSLGHYPVETITTMSQIAQYVEDVFKTGIPVEYDPEHLVSHAIAHSAKKLAENVGASMILALTESGRAAREIAQFHGSQPILAVTPSITTARALSITRGVTGYIYAPKAEITHIRPELKKIAHNHGASSGESIVICSGNRMRKTGSTNMVMVETV
jgi:pyruvate kinase